MSDSGGTNFKAREIEELADVYFFRPVGMAIARAARVLGLAPSAVTAAAGLVGVAGGALLYVDDLALAGFALIIAHGVLDSSDGQLARMTGRESESGRMLDGLAGFATYVAIFIAIASSEVARGAAAWPVVGWCVLAGVATLAHAQMYDYHRSAYIRTAIKGAVSRPSSQSVVRVYEAIESWLAWSHRPVERALASRSSGEIVREDDRVRYRRCFYRPVRGWNLLGDNTRFYAVGVLAWFHHLDYLFAFVLVPMNIAFGLLALWQARADRRFLGEL